MLGGFNIGGPRFPNYEYTVEKNSQGIYRIDINDQGRWRYVTDIDVIGCISGNHISEIQYFFSLEQVEEFIEKHITVKEEPEVEELKIKPDFVKVDI